MDVKEEFSVGNMAPVVQPDQILSKTENYDYIDDAYDSLDLKIPEFEEGDDVAESSNFNATHDEIKKDKTQNLKESIDIVTESKKIDDDMLPITKALEAKGYDVKYSCSGHPSARTKNDVKRDGVRYDNLYSSARIVFSKVYNIDSAPKGWIKKTLNSDDKKSGNEYTALYVDEKRFKIVDGTPKNAFYKWKSSYMASLKSWVDSLPAIGQDSTMKESVDVDVTVESMLDELFVDML